MHSTATIDAITTPNRRVNIPNDTQNKTGTTILELLQYAKYPKKPALAKLLNCINSKGANFVSINPNTTASINTETHKGDFNTPLKSKPAKKSPHINENKNTNIFIAKHNSIEINEILNANLSPLLFVWTLIKLFSIFIFNFARIICPTKLTA